MGKYTGPKNRLSRREGIDLFGKGNKLRRATVPPGQHGPKGARRLSDYGVQLREKQKAKRIYGLMERQFAKYFVQDSKNFFSLLERRLDNVVYRLGLAPTRVMARQLVSHRHVRINNAVVNIPSYQVSPGETVSLSSKAIAIPAVKTCLENAEYLPPAWLARQAAVGQVLAIPTRADIDTSINDQLIVECYSR